MGIIILFLYVIISFSLLFIIRKSKISPSEYFVSGRNASYWDVGLSIIASCVGASATVGMIGLAFSSGVPAFWWLGSGAAGLLILTLFVAKKVRRTEKFTMSGTVETFLSPSCKPVVSVVIVISWTAILAAQFAAMLKIVAALTSFSHLPALIISAAVIILHTFLGGQWAVIKFDKIQILIIFAGLISVLAWLFLHNDFPSETGIEIYNDKFPLPQVFYYLLIVGGSYVICPMLFGRVLSAKNETAAKKGGMLAVFGLIIGAVLITMIGIYSKGLIPAATKPDDVLPALFGMVFPKWLFYVVSVTLLSAIVSSADSCLITAATVLSNDIFVKNDMKTCRTCVLVLGLAAAFLTFMDRSIIGFLLMANDVYVCGVVVPVFIGIVFYGRFKIKKQAALQAIIAGSILGILAAVTENNIYAYAALLTSFLITVFGYGNQFYKKLNEF